MEMCFTAPRQVVAIAHRLVRFGPVFDAIRGCVLGLSTRSFMRFAQGTHRWLAGWVMSKHTDRYHEH